MADKIKVTLVKSTISALPKHKKTVEALGLGKLNSSNELPNNEYISAKPVEMFGSSMSDARNGEGKGS